MSLSPVFNFNYSIKWDRLNVPGGNIHKAIFHNNLLFLATARKLIILDTCNSAQAEDWIPFQSILVNLIDFDTRGDILVLSKQNEISIFKNIDNKFVWQDKLSSNTNCTQLRISNDLKYFVCLFKSNESTWFEMFLFPNYKIFSSQNWSSFLSTSDITSDLVNINFSVNEMHFVASTTNKSYFFPIATLSYEITPSYLNSLYPCLLTKNELHMCISVSNPYNIPNGSHFIPLAYPPGFKCSNFKLINILNTPHLLFLAQGTRINIFSKSSTTWQVIDFKSGDAVVVINSICFIHNSLLCLVTTNTEQCLTILDFNHDINLENIPKIKINYSAYRLDYIKPYLYLFGNDSSISAYHFDGIKKIECSWTVEMEINSKLTGFVLNHIKSHQLSGIISHNNSISLLCYDIEESTMQLTNTLKTTINYSLIGLSYFPIFTDLFSHCYTLLGPGIVKIFCMINKTPFDFCVDYKVEALPVAVDIQRGLLLLVEIEASRVFHDDAPFIKYISTTQPFLHKFAFKLCEMDDSLLGPYLQHFNRDSNYEGYLELVFGYFWQEGKHVPILIKYLKSYVNFYDVLAKVARKMESIYWKDLFKLVNEAPDAILQKCLKLEKYRTASCYLVLCQNTTEFVEQDCIQLLKGALDIKDMQLSREILDYIHKISGNLLKLI